MKDVENGLGLNRLGGMVENKICGIYEIKHLTKKQRKKYKRTAGEISKELKNDPENCKYLRNDVMEEVIKNCRGVKSINDNRNRLDKRKQRNNFRQLLGFKENQIFETKEYSIVKQIKKVFIGQKIIEQYRVEKYFIDLYFPDHKLGIKVDENCHLDRSEIKEQEREETIKNLGTTLIRVNPDQEGFDIFIKIGEIQDFIYKSGLKIGEELKKNKMIEDLERSVRLKKIEWVIDTLHK